MDVLVKWESGGINVVSSEDIEPIIKNSVLRVGAKIKMYWPPEKQYYFGTIINTEGYYSEDNIPLSTSPASDARNNDPTCIQHCEFQKCKTEVFAACERCLALLCWNHFEANENCTRHGDLSNKYFENGRKEQNTESNKEVKIRVNKKKIAHELRTKGKAYVSPATKKAIRAKFIKPRCDPSNKCGKECNNIDDEQRKNIFDAFYDCNSLQLQREFIVRYVEAQDVKRKRTKADNSRRTRTYNYNLPSANSKTNVCKTMFLNTLGISEKTLRTAISKQTDEGVVEKERRGGRYKQLKEKDEKVRASVLQHIQRFPRMDSHCLTVKKMFSLYKEENPGKDTMCSYHTYRKVFRSLNLSFHHPKKEQCSL